MDENIFEEKKSATCVINLNLHGDLKLNCLYSLIFRDCYDSRATFQTYRLLPPLDSIETSGSQPWGNLDTAREKFSDDEITRNIL